MAERPEPGWEAPAGTEHIAVPEGEDWRPVTGKRCRAQAGDRKACGGPSVMEINRGRMTRRRLTGRYENRPCWWAYCADHTYGRWIEDGRVMHWIVREIEGGEPAALPPGTGDG